MMMGSNLMDGIDCASFFDQIDDLIDFLPEDKCEGDIVGANGGLVNSGGFPVMWDDDVPNPDVFLSKNSSADLSGELYVPYEDIVQLEWISNFVDDSFSNEGFGLGKDTIDKKDNNNSTQLFQVLESSSSSSSSSNSTNSSSIETKPNNGIPPCGPQRARSKRPRPPAFNPRPSIQLVETVTFSENFVESDPPHEKIPEESDDRETKKKKKMKTGDEGVVPAHHQQQAAAPRKCAHCEITKTPQWRAGPGGPKTLCNACGVRYKSGRLFPEYRPAASPTFVPSVHSNSHKKVVEMRNKKDGRASTSNASAVINDDDNNRNSNV